LSDFVREALAKELAAGPGLESPCDAWVRLVKGCVGSGESCRSVTCKARISEKLRAEHRP
jgi:hypothetical protein